MLTIRKLAIASVSLLALATPAMAQDAAAEDAGEEFASSSNEIVVQARRRDESVQDVPAVVNAVTAASIDKLNLRRLEDVTSVVPGLTLTANSNGIGSTTSMRGVQYDVITSGNNGTVQYYFNDAPVASGVVLSGLFDVELIEVLRGPQGTLKGRAAPSGSISMTFRRPDLDEVGGYAMGTVNDIDGYNVNGAMNVPIIEGKLGIRLAGLVSDDDGNRVHPVGGGGQKLKNRTEAGRVSLRVDPFDGVFVVDGSYSTMNTDSRQYIQAESVNQVVDGAAPSPVTVRAKDRLAVNRVPIENDISIKNYNVNAHLNAYGQRLTYVGNWTNQKVAGSDPSRDGDRAGLFANPSGPLFGLAPDRTPVPVVPSTVVPFSQPNLSKAKIETHEIRLQNEDRIAGIFDYVAGYLNYTIDAPTSFEQVGGVISMQPGTINGIILLPLQRFNNSEEQSVFGNLTAHIGDVELSGGLRHIWYSSESGLRGCNSGFVTCTEIDAYHNSTDDEATIYSVSAKYKFTPDLMGYVSYGTSWRPETTLIGGPSAPLPAQEQFLRSDPEKSKSVEAGIKSNWLDGRLSLNLSAYYQEFDNNPYRSPGSGVYSIDAATNTVKQYNYISAVPIEVKGVEAELAFSIMRNWSISGNVAYADGKIKNGNIPCLDLNGDGIPDQNVSPPTLPQLQAATNGGGVSVCNVTQRANSASPWSASVQSEYTHALNDNMDGFLRGLFTWQGNAIGDPQNSYDSVKSYGLLNLFAGVRASDGAWEVTAYGKNITNAFRVLTRSNGAEFTTVNGVANSSTNYFSITSTQPQEFGVTARFAFGSR